MAERSVFHLRPDGPRTELADKLALVAAERRGMGDRDGAETLTRASAAIRDGLPSIALSDSVAELITSCREALRADLLQAVDLLRGL